VFHVVRGLRKVPAKETQREKPTGNEGGDELYNILNKNNTVQGKALLLYCCGISL